MIEECEVNIGQIVFEKLNNLKTPIEQVDTP